jgi:hypothetical protein
MTQTFDSFLESVRKNWMLIAFIGGLIYSYADLKNGMESLRRSDEDKMKILLDIGVSGSQLKRDLMDLKSSQARTEQEVQDIREFVIKK